MSYVRKKATDLQVHDVFEYISGRRFYESRVVEPGVMSTARDPSMVIIYCDPSPRGQGYLVARKTADFITRVLD